MCFRHPLKGYAMSMHKIPLADVERDGLKKHGLSIGTPSQLSDVFRQGVAHGAAAEREACAKVCEVKGAIKYAGLTIGEQCAAAIRARGTP